MIPKVIHYCWFGGNPLPKLAKKCIKSWKKYCKGYEIIRWDESNYDLDSAPLYVRQAYEAKKWAFVTDYVRLQVVYEHGGIYLDTDVELVRSPSELLNYHAYFGFENGVHISTGLGFGAEKGAPILQELMMDYADIPFVLEDGSFDQTSCPVRNTNVFVHHGLVQNNTQQMLLNNVCILPSEWLCPLDYDERKLYITEYTVAIHWFSASWLPMEMRPDWNSWYRRRQAMERRDYYSRMPNRLLLGLLGEKRYQKLKGKLTKK